MTLTVRLLWGINLPKQKKNMLQVMNFDSS